MQVSGKEAPSFEPGSENARIVELVRVRGYAAIPEILSPADVHDYGRRLDSVYEQQAVEIGARLMEEIGEADVARCLLAYDVAFLDLVCHPTVLEIVRALVGEYVVLHLQNGIIVRPQRTHHQTTWHRDLPYQKFVSSRPLAVNVLFCLEDFSKETGGTVFLPFSHREETLPSRDTVEILADQPAFPAGSAIVFDSMVFHRAGNNVSNRTRRGLNHVFTTGIVRQQIDIPGWLPDQNRELHERAVADPELRTLLGYDARTADSVRAFRERRIERAARSPRRQNENEKN